MSGQTGKKQPRRNQKLQQIKKKPEIIIINFISGFIAYRSQKKNIC